MLMDASSRELKIKPSLASADTLNLAAAIDSLGDIPDLHLDIEDGNFVPNITFGMKTIDRVVGYTDGKKNLDVHLLANNPETWIEKLARYPIKQIAVHFETLTYPLETLKMISDHGIKAGVALNFLTPAEAIYPFMKHIDYVIVMTAEPDGLGELFYPGMLDKIRKVADMCDDVNAVWADGGITKDTIKSVFDAGASNIVLGRTMFNGESAELTAREILKICT